MSARGFLGAGDLYMARYVNGAFEGWKGPFECTKFEVKPNIDLKEMTSKGKITYGQVIESVALQQPADFTVDLAEVNKDSLAIALLGTTSSLSQASGALADFAFIGKHDVWVDLGKLMLNATFTIENSAGTTTYVEGTDYLLNRDLGWIKVLASGTIADNANLMCSGAYAAVSGTTINGAATADLRVRFKLDGKNQVDQSPVIVTAHEVVIAADSAFDFLADDFNTVSMPGRMKTPAGYTSPFTVHTITPA